MIADDIRAALAAVAEPDRVGEMQRYFKTDPGEYAEGDVFIGVRVPALRRVAKEFAYADLEVVEELLHSPVHEERQTALLILVHQFGHGDWDARDAIYDLYLRSTEWINNWDLVDCSAPGIVGAMLFRDSAGWELDRLAGSPLVWDRRIAMVATLTFIRNGQLDHTWRIAELLHPDRHDLIRKATGWMLREAGKRDEAALVAFVEQHAAEMSRTTLRYAIERLAADERTRLMQL